jgi:hypothetical protein
MPLPAGLVTAARDAFERDGLRVGLKLQDIASEGDEGSLGLRDVDIGSDFYFYVEIWLPSDTEAATAPSVSLVRLFFIWLVCVTFIVSLLVYRCLDSVAPSQFASSRGVSWRPQTRAVWARSDCTPSWNAGTIPLEGVRKIDGRGDGNCQHLQAKVQIVRPRSGRLGLPEDRRQPRGTTAC